MEKEKRKRAKGSWWSLGEVLKEVRVRDCLQGSLVRELGRAEAGKVKARVREGTADHGRVGAGNAN